MAKKKSAAELRAENKFLRQHGIGNNITKVALELIRYGAFAVIALFVYLSIAELAGKTTDADISVHAEGKFNLGRADEKPELECAKLEASPYYNGALFLLLLVGLSGAAFGKRQARLRKNTVEQLQGRIKELEQHIDEGRTSSKLTSRGDTNPEDL